MKIEDMTEEQAKVLLIKVRFALLEPMFRQWQDDYALKDIELLSLYEEETDLC